MKYIIYKTTNLLDGKYYIGCHQTENLNDGYLGSGKHLRYAIKKYGIENFQFEILHYAASKKEMFELEHQIVNEQIVKDPLSYNLKLGGSGGNPGIVGAFKGRKHTETTKEKQRQASLKQVTTQEKRIKLSQNNWAKKDPDAFKKHVREINLGKTISLEQKQKLSIAQKGKKLVNNGKIAKWVNGGDIPNLLQQGWILGKIKK